MASSQGINVFRYSALFAGIAYGFYHQSSITSAARASEINKQFERKANLISQAKAEWVKKTAPPEVKTPTGGIITNPDDPKFDLEAFLISKTGEEAGKLNAQ